MARSLQVLHENLLYSWLKAAVIQFKNPKKHPRRKILDLNARRHSRTTWKLLSNISPLFTLGIYSDAHKPCDFPGWQNLLNLNPSIWKLKPNTSAPLVPATPTPPGTAASFHPHLSGPFYPYYHSSLPLTRGFKNARAMCHLGKVALLLHSLPPFPPNETFTPHPLDFRATRSELSLHLLKLWVPGDDGSPESSVITLITALTHIHTSKKELRSLFFLSSPHLCPRSSVHIPLLLSALLPKCTSRDVRASPRLHQSALLICWLHTRLHCLQRHTSRISRTELNASWHGCSPQTVYLLMSDTVGRTGHNQTTRTVKPPRSDGRYSVTLFWWNSLRCEDECEVRGVKADEERNSFRWLKSLFFCSKIVISTIWVLILVHDHLRRPAVINHSAGLGPFQLDATVSQELHKKNRT